MSFECFLKGDFTGTGHLEALFSAGVCFYLWHIFNNLSRLHPAGGPELTGHLLGLTGNLGCKGKGIFGNYLIFLEGFRIAETFPHQGLLLSGLLKPGLRFHCHELYKAQPR